MSDHKHQMVFLGRLQGGHGGDYPVYWCRDCGPVWESFGRNYAEMVPEYRKELAGCSNFEFVPEGSPTPSRKSGVRSLGRGLIEINASKQQGSKLQELFFGGNKDGKE